MNTIMGIIVFACLFGGALFGMYLRRRLPESHLDEKSLDIVKLGMGLTGTMAALLLSLLLGSAKSSFDTVNNELKGESANIIFLDRHLAYYGPEAQPLRDLLRKLATEFLVEMWPSERKQPLGSQGGARDRELLYNGILGLTPSTDGQRSAKAQALSLAYTVAQTRWLMVEQQVNATSMTVIVVLVSWLTIIFIGLGLFAPRNATVVCALFACAFSISGAIFLLLELYTPFSGVVQISSEPLRYAITSLGH